MDSRSGHLEKRLEGGGWHIHRAFIHYCQSLRLQWSTTWWRPCFQCGSLRVLTVEKPSRRELKETRWHEKAQHCWLRIRRKKTVSPGRHIASKSWKRQANRPPTKASRRNTALIQTWISVQWEHCRLVTHRTIRKPICIALSHSLYGNIWLAKNLFGFFIPSYGKT